jgi:uncharacterized membrane protein HdeD (DUF308 family)
MYEFCDLKWGTITATGLLAFLAGIAAILIPHQIMGLMITFSAVVILVLAGILIAEGLFMEGKGISRWALAGIGVVGILLALVALVYPGWIILTGGVILGLCLIVFGCLMIFAAATIIFDFFVRGIVAFSSFFAVMLGIYFVFVPESTLIVFDLAVGTFLVLYGIVRMVYGFRLREWQKSCPAPFLREQQ